MLRGLLQGMSVNQMNIITGDNAHVSYEAQGDTKHSEQQPGEEATLHIKAVIDLLKEEGVLKHLYDYTWLMEVMNQTEGMPKFNSPASLISFLKDSHVEHLPSEDSINRKQNVFSGTFPDWVFADCDSTEANRRINVGKRFLSAYRKG